MPRREYYQKNKEHLREYNRKYLRNWHSATAEDYTTYLREYFRKYRQAPEQRVRNNARNAVNRLIAKGELTRGVCETLLCEDVGEAHHDDYSQPLKVRWLCKIHHEEHHHNN